MPFLRADCPEESVLSTSTLDQTSRLYLQVYDETLTRQVDRTPEA